MAIIEKQTPHEFLVRWDDAGNLKGAHIAHRIAYVDDATAAEAFSKFGDPQGVDLTNASLLSEISASINQSALADNTAKAAQIAQLTSERDAQSQAREAAEAARDEAQAMVQQLQAQLAEYQTPVDENGVPKAVTMRQGQEEMLFTPTVDASLTLLDWVEAAINAIADPITKRAALITWTKSTMIERDFPLVLQLRPVVQQALGLADLAAAEAAIDQMFIRAAQR